MAPFALSAGPLFGEKLGTPAILLLGLAAITFNLIVAYWLARRWLRPPLARLVARLGYTLPAVERGDATDLIVLLRVTPGPPFFVQNYLLGLAEVPLRPLPRHLLRRAVVVQHRLHALRRRRQPGPWQGRDHGDRPARRTRRRHPPRAQTPRPEEGRRMKPRGAGGGRPAGAAIPPPAAGVADPRPRRHPARGERDGVHPSREAAPRRRPPPLVDPRRNLQPAPAGQRPRVFLAQGRRRPAQRGAVPRRRPAADGEVARRPAGDRVRRGERVRGARAVSVDRAPGGRRRRGAVATRVRGAQGAARGGGALRAGAEAAAARPAADDRFHHLAHRRGGAGLPAHPGAARVARARRRAAGPGPGRRRGGRDGADAATRGGSAADSISS
jgi:hypothetical protein